MIGCLPAAERARCRFGSRAAGLLFGAARRSPREQALAASVCTIRFRAAWMCCTLDPYAAWSGPTDKPVAHPRKVQSRMPDPTHMAHGKSPGPSSYADAECMSIVHCNNTARAPGTHAGLSSHGQRANLEATKPSLTAHTLGANPTGWCSTHHPQPSAPHESSLARHSGNSGRRKFSPHLCASDAPAATEQRLRLGQFPSCKDLLKPHCRSPWKPWKPWGGIPAASHRRLEPASVARGVAKLAVVGSGGT